MQMAAQPPMQMQAPQAPVAPAAPPPMQMQAPQAPVAPAAPQVRGLLSELLTKLTAPGASPKGAQWCGQELPRAMSALQTAQHQQGVLQDASSRLTTAAAVAEKAAKDLDSRDAALATVAGEAGRDVKAEAAVLAAEVQQHDVALHALREGLAVMEDAQDMRDVAGGLEDLQELAQKSAADIQVLAEQLAGAVSRARAAATELAKGKRREQHDAGLRAAAATRDSQENAEQIALATKYVETLQPACASEPQANQARAEEVEAVRQAARIVDAATA